MAYFRRSKKSYNLPLPPSTVVPRSSHARNTFHQNLCLLLLTFVSFWLSPLFLFPLALPFHFPHLPLVTFRTPCPFLFQKMIPLFFPLFLSLFHSFVLSLSLYLSTLSPYHVFLFLPSLTFYPFLPLSFNFPFLTLPPFLVYPCSLSNLPFLTPLTSPLIPTHAPTPSPLPSTIPLHSNFY